jgi:hypothetical protein
VEEGDEAVDVGVGPGGGEGGDDGVGVGHASTRTRCASNAELVPDAGAIDGSARRVVRVAP